MTQGLWREGVQLKMAVRPPSRHQQMAGCSGLGPGQRSGSRRKAGGGAYDMGWSMPQMLSLLRRDETQSKGRRTGTASGPRTALGRGWEQMKEPTQRRPEAGVSEDQGAVVGTGRAQWGQGVDRVVSVGTSSRCRLRGTGGGGSGHKARCAGAQSQRGLTPASALGVRR